MSIRGPVIGHSTNICADWFTKIQNEDSEMLVSVIYLVNFSKYPNIKYKKLDSETKNPQTITVAKLGDKVFS